MLNLRIRNHTFNWGDLFGRDRIIVYVTVKSINRLNVSGSGDVFFKNGLSANSFELRLSGSGDVMGRLNVNTLNCGISGSGDIKLSGRANSSAVNITGSGDFSARDLITTSTMIRVSGSGDAGVNASQQIDAHISGSGDIHYTGGARRVSSSIWGYNPVLMELRCRMLRRRRMKHWLQIRHKQQLRHPATTYLSGNFSNS